MYAHTLTLYRQYQEVVLLKFYCMKMLNKNIIFAIFHRTSTVYIHSTPSVEFNLILFNQEFNLLL